jgi:hypothetical protein
MQLTREIQSPTSQSQQMRSCGESKLNVPALCRGVTQRDRAESTTQAIVLVIVCFPAEAASGSCSCIYGE